MKNRLLLFSLAFLIIIGLVGCSANSNKQENQSAGGTIKIGYVTILSDSPAIIAKEKKLMEAQGLTAEFYPFANGPDLYKALSSGKLDVAYAGVPAGVNWSARGAKVKAIAKVSDGKFGLMTKGNSDISKASDLKGKKIGSVVQGSGVDILLRGFILPEGELTEDQVSILQMKMPVMEQAVSKGSVDATLAGEPYLTFAELRGLNVVKEVPDPALIVLATEDFLNNQEQTVKQFMEGHKASIEFLNNNKQESSEILAKAFNVPEITDQTGKVWSPSEVLAKALERHTFAYKIDENDFKFYQEIADANYKLNMIDQPFEVTSLFDLSWIK